MQEAANWPASRAALFVVSAQQLAGFWIDEMHTLARQALDGPVHVIVRAIIGQPCLHVLARGGTSIEEGTHLIRASFGPLECGSLGKSCVRSKIGRQGSKQAGARMKEATSRAGLAGC